MPRAKPARQPRISVAHCGEADVIELLSIPIEDVSSHAPDKMSRPAAGRVLQGGERSRET